MSITGLRSSMAEPLEGSISIKIIIQVLIFSEAIRAKYASKASS